MLLKVNPVVHVREVVAAIEAVVLEARGTLSFTETALGLPEEMDETPLLAALGALPHTSLAEGVATTIVIMRQAVQDGRLAPQPP